MPSPWSELLLPATLGCPRLPGDKNLQPQTAVAALRTVGREGRQGPLEAVGLVGSLLPEAACAGAALRGPGRAVAMGQQWGWGGQAEALPMPPRQAMSVPGAGWEGCQVRGCGILY